ncbi:MAG TPA: hypothetical protein VGR62_05415 [Candidatus Binatia bacterium]|nr:hypothetical protein [Candidatus Binatia bacterium]
MRRIVFTSWIALAMVLGAEIASAQGVADGLQCYKITNTNLRNLRAVVDLDAPSIGVAPGCRIGKAKLYCAPATQTVQPGTLFDGDTPLTELPHHGPSTRDRICYDVTCPRDVGVAPSQVATDRFGTHAFRNLKTEMVCTSATGGTMPSPAQGFEITTPEIELSPRQNVTYCYRFRTANAEPLAIKRFASEMGAASRQVMLFTTTTHGGAAFDGQPPGTLSAIDCGFYPSGGQYLPHWLYESHTQLGSLEFPSDDGAGNPVAYELPPLSSGVLMVHSINPADDVVTTRAKITIEALDSPIYTRTDSFTAYQASIVVPPYTNGDVESRTCNVPADAKFWWLSTHTHRHATGAGVYDGPDVVLSQTDWANPSVLYRQAPPYQTFHSNTLHWSCAYDNPHGYTIRTGDSQQSDEQCVTMGYFFPATKPLLCYDGYQF